MYVVTFDKKLKPEAEELSEVTEGTFNGSILEFSTTVYSNYFIV